MLTGFATAAAVLLALLVLTFQKMKKFQRQAVAHGHDLAAARAEAARVQQVSEAAVQEMHKLVNQQMDTLRREGERIREHYETEAREARAASDDELRRALQQLQSLQKYQGLVDAEHEASRLLAEALEEAASLRSEASALLDVARAATAPGRNDLVARPRES